MKLVALTATLALLVFGAFPAFAGQGPDTDGDTVIDALDNCSDLPNSDQDDTDGDDCGNICDADFDQDGVVGFADFGEFGAAFNGFDLEKDLSEIVTGPVGFGDFGKFGAFFNGVPGPSGTTAGTLVCP